MKKTYCVFDERETPCTEPNGYQKDKRGRMQFYCTCAVCGIKKVRYVKMGTTTQTGAGVRRKTKKEKSKN